MNRVECPWCGRIFPAYEGHDIPLLLGGWALICDICNDMMEQHSGEPEQ